MGSYVMIGELNTWYDEEGVGDPLVLCHGGLATNETWAAQMPTFAARFRVIAPERRGHGHTPDVDEPLSYELMAADLIGFLDRMVGGPSHLLGWSDGGIIGLLVAMARPDLVHKLIAVSANFDTSGVVPEFMDELRSLRPDSDDLEVFRTSYEAVSPDGPGHWPTVFAKFQEMVSIEPNITVEQLGRISAPTLVLASDDDMISLEHTVALFRAIPHSELAIVPGTSHFLLMEKPELVNRLALDFLEQDSAPTFMPFTRAPSAGPTETAPVGD
jgi:pimeloyl-ACP methyl ester carboxylesterase